jgi:hypothetical protein
MFSLWKHTDQPFCIILRKISMIRLKECNDIPNDDTSRYFIDHTVQGTMGAHYDIDDTIRLGAPYDIGDIVSTDYFFSTKNC